MAYIWRFGTYSATKTIKNKLHCTFMITFDIPLIGCNHGDPRACAMESAGCLAACGGSDDAHAFHPEGL